MESKTDGTAGTSVVYIVYDNLWITMVLCLSAIGLMMTLAVRRSMFLYSLRNVPSPLAMPIIGNAWQLNCSLEEFFKKLVTWSREFGDIYQVWLGMRPLIFVYRAEGVQPLLSSSVHIDKSLEYQYLRPWLGNGLILSGGEQWHFRRKLLTPTFHKTLLEEYLTSTMREAAVMVTCLRAEIGKSEFDIVPYAKRAALDMICASSMGYHINAQTNRNNEYVVAVETMTSIIQTRFTNVWLSLDFIFHRTPLGKIHEQALNVIQTFISQVIADRKAEWKLKHDGNFNESPRKRLALLDMLLECSQNGTILSDQDIKDEVNTFMFAGHDTTAMSVSWILYALGTHPEYQKKILDEYDETIGSNDITLELLNKLVWLDACIKEAWRMYPVVPLIGRQIYKPINLMNHEVPAGSTVLINTFLLHRDPRYFAQPEVYKPERFFADGPKLPAFSYIPFSAGSRNCIGFKFATMETKVTILSILKSYVVSSIEPADKIRPISSIVLINANGIRLKISPRK